MIEEMSAAEMPIPPIHKNWVQICIVDMSMVVLKQICAEPIAELRPFQTTRPMPR